MSKYNGHKNWNHWNVSLWINNDEGLYQIAKACIRRNYTKQAASEEFLRHVKGMGYNSTPDGAPYSKTTILAAMRGM